jgi:peptidoglycan/LPS O-acetylase OafA/YrhL
MSQAESKSRSVGLDLMRFVAVVMVIYAHANMFPSTRKFFVVGYHSFFDALYTLRTGAWVGVDLFFVLSGFLISGLMFKELAQTGTISVGRFLIRRGFKIYPPFWVMILVTVIRMWCSGATVSLKTLLTELFFLQNYVVGPPPTYVGTFWGITWSLAVEEHFYFMLAGLFYILKKRAGPGRAANIQALPKLFLWVAIGCTVARFITWLFVPNEPKTMIWFLRATHVRMDALFFGVLLSYYWHNRWDETFKARLAANRWVFAVAGLALLFPAIYEHEEWFRIIGFVFTYLGAGYLLMCFLSLDRSPCNLCIRWMAWLGKHSYSVYLWHILAGTWLLPFVTSSSNPSIWWAGRLIF